MFIGRHSELKMLDAEFVRVKERGSLAVVYGRRRVGKTSLLVEFSGKKRAAYFLATLQPEVENIRHFSEKAAEVFGDETGKLEPRSTWDGFFGYIQREAARTQQPLLLVFDEVTYLFQQNPALPSIIQKYWDTALSKLPIMMVLCGSYVGMMEREILSYKAPLYGRASRTLEIGEMRFPFLSKFFPKHCLNELVEAYSAAGGTPAYLASLDARKPLRENLKAAFFDKSAFLFNDAEALLREELNEPRSYFAVLKAIAFGKSSAKEISDSMGMQPFITGRYLDVLRGMKLVQRITPITEKTPDKSRNGAYVIMDNYYSFWLKFVQPNLDRIETGTIGEYLESREFADAFQTSLGRVFEKVCSQHFSWLNRTKKLGFTRIGKWWNRSGEEIDIAALGEGKAAAAECKYTNKPLALGDVLALDEKTKLVEWPGKKTHVQLFFYSRKGFTHEALYAIGERKGVAFSEKELMQWVKAESR